MTADLGAIRARLAAATPGEWVAHEYRERGSGEVFLRVVETYSADVIAPDRVDCTSYCYGGTSRYTLGAADADLIAHAPADLAALCDEVERLRAAVERARAVHYWAARAAAEAVDAIDPGADVEGTPECINWVRGRAIAAEAAVERVRALLRDPLSVSDFDTNCYVPMVKVADIRHALRALDGAS